MRKIRLTILLMTFVLFMAFSLGAKDEPVEYLRGVNFSKEGKYEKAREEFRKFLNLYPDSPLVPEVYFKMAESMDDFYKSIRGYRNLILRYPGVPFAQTAQFRIGRYYYLKGDYKQSLADYRKFLELYSGHLYAPAAQYWVGNCLLIQKRYNESITEFQKVLEKYPRSNYLDWARLGIGDSYFRKGDYSLAAKEYEKILERYSESDILNFVYFNLGQCYEKEKKEKEALEAYQRVITECPDSLEVVEARKRISALQKKFISPGGRYSVQVGAFGNKANADRLVRRLRDKDYQAYILTISIEGRLFYRVRVGRLATRKKAQKLATKLSKKDDLPTRICSD